MAKALIPGSYDPITLGHLDIIRRVAERFDTVYVAVMTNDMQQYVPGVSVKRYRFTMDERREMAVLACADIPHVEVLSATGRLIDLVDELDVDWIIKGVRSEADFAYEQQHALYNRAHNPRAETLYLPADPALDGISSTVVRDKLASGEALSDYLSQAVIAWLREHKFT